MFNKSKIIADLRQRIKEEESSHNIEQTRLRLKLDAAEARLQQSQDHVSTLTAALHQVTAALSKQVQQPRPEPIESSQLSKPIIDLNFNDYVFLRPDSYPCKECPFEHTPCKKLSFHDRTICIIHRDHVKDLEKDPS